MKLTGSYNTSKPEHGGLVVFLGALALLQLYFLWNNETVYGGADNVGHYHIARYAFKYPHLFLNSWGKPLFTLMLAPLSLFGFKAAQLFNLIVALITLFFTWKIARVIFPKASLAVVVMAAFAPVYFLLMLSTLTEILFSFVLVVSVYLFIKNKFIFSAVLISFIPFVRTEGIIFFPVFALAFALKRSFWAIPALAVGTIFYSVLGFLVFDDFLWLVNRFPYPKGESVYGSGSFFHFVENSNFIFGIPFFVLIVTGLLFWMYELYSNFSLKNNSLFLFILIVGCWFGYFAAHSFVWWKGMGGSLGLIRVIGGVIPLAAVTGAKGIQFLFEKIRKDRIVHAVIVGLAVAQVYMLFSQNRLPLRAGVVDKLVATSAAYLKNENIEGRIFYFDPRIPFLLGVDPYESSKTHWFWGNNTHPSQFMNFGDILIWDAHFGPNEGRTPYGLVESDPLLNKIKTFLPGERKTVLGGHEYEIHIYRKEKQKKEYPIFETYKRHLEMPVNHAYRSSGDVDSVFVEIKNEDEYGPSVVVSAKELPDSHVYEIEAEARFKSNELVNDNEALLVFSVENGKELLHYITLSLLWGENESDWKTVSLNRRIPGNLPDSALVKVYVWNRGRKNIYLKELSTQITGY